VPFKSQAQRRKFAQLLVEGKISNETFEEWNRETGGARLPERVKRNKAGATKRNASDPKKKSSAAKKKKEKKTSGTTRKNAAGRRKTGSKR
jgi:hypothetical protein